MGDETPPAVRRIWFAFFFWAAAIGVYGVAEALNQPVLSDSALAVAGVAVVFMFLPVAKAEIE